MFTLTPKDLSLLIDTSPGSIELIDVRNQDEYDAVHLASTNLIPLPVLSLRIDEIDTKKQIIILCKSGGRSGQACLYLESK
jgi:rhodanese-related sulfurtransferase